MRRLLRALMAAPLLAVMAAAPASAAQPPVFEGRIAEATWLACDESGCTATTASIRVGTWTRNDGWTLDVQWLCVRQDPSPLPVVFRRISGCVEAGSVARDLSTASGSGTVGVTVQSCDENNVCHPGSLDWIGDEPVSAAWTATGPTVRHSETSVAHLTRITGEECTYVTVQTGVRRDATASLTWGSRKLGELSSAWIADVTERFRSACHSRR